MNNAAHGLNRKCAHSAILIGELTPKRGVNYIGIAAALELEIAREDGHCETVRLGSDLSSGERPQAIVPAQAWQAPQALGDWTLAGCTVAPGFEFAKFKLAPKGWGPE